MISGTIRNTFAFCFGVLKLEINPLYSGQLDEIKESLGLWAEPSAGFAFLVSVRLKSIHAYFTMETDITLCGPNLGQEGQEERWFWFDRGRQAKALDSPAIAGEQAQGGS